MPVAGVLRRPQGYCALSTPRISYGPLKTAICACPWGSTGTAVLWRVPGVGAGWVPGGWYTGVLGGGIPGTQLIGIARAQPLAS